MKNDILSRADNERETFISRCGTTPEKIVARRRYETAEEIAALTVSRDEKSGTTLTDKIDRVVLHKFAGPLVLMAIIFLFYELSIVQGYKITGWTWPLLAAARDFIASLLPQPGFVFDPILRTAPLGVIDGIVAVLNYIPIFLILFALIAVMEDSGYMARVSFLLDRLFRYFGLQGQSAMPLILSGVFVGGCAVPGVMACRTIKDEKARLATMLVIPLMNCMAKLPLYVLLAGMFFAEHKGVALFFISTITLIVALAAAKILSLTLLKSAETAPFVLELPVYHLPAAEGVLRRCLERTWLFIKKIISVVAVVGLVIYLLLNFPALDAERTAYYESIADQHTGTFFESIGKDNPYAAILEKTGVNAYAVYQADYRKARMHTRGAEEKTAIDNKFMKRNEAFFRIANRGRYERDGQILTDGHALRVSREYRQLDGKRMEIKANIREETINGSILGRLGRALEPVSRYAGFNWRVNVALISAFAAKENSVATLGTIYQTSGEEDKSLEHRMMEKEKEWTPLHALALIIFMTMYPPCIATLLMIKVESGSWKWALFASFYPVVAGSLMAALVFTGGNLLGLNGMQAMVAFYLVALLGTTGLGFIKNNDEQDDYL